MIALGFKKRVNDTGKAASVLLMVIGAGYTYETLARMAKMERLPARGSLAVWWDRFAFSWYVRHMKTQKIHNLKVVIK